MLSIYGVHKWTWECFTADCLIWAIGSKSSEGEGGGGGVNNKNKKLYKSKWKTLVSVEMVVNNPVKKKCEREREQTKKLVYIVDVFKLYTY